MLPVFYSPSYSRWLIEIWFLIDSCSLQADVLVATTVIENGVDMPNVNTIIVLDAHRWVEVDENLFVVNTCGYVSVKKTWIIWALKILVSEIV